MNLAKCEDCGKMWDDETQSLVCPHLLLRSALPELNAITDLVLGYRPKPKSKAAKKRTAEVNNNNSVAGKTMKEFLVFNFVCEACGAEGDLTLQVKDGMKRFNCPEGCGAVYIPWQNPLNFNRWELKTVVLPVYRP